jgi:hypothetical protein
VSSLTRFAASSTQAKDLTAAGKAVGVAKSALAKKIAEDIYAGELEPIT